jgi:hypothetical protein
MGLTTRTTFGLMQACLEVEGHLELSANGCLYDGLKTSTLNANVPEPFCQTLERQGDAEGRAGGRPCRAWSGYPEQNCQLVNSRTLWHQLFEPHTGPVLLATAAVGQRNAGTRF